MIKRLIACAMALASAISLAADISVGKWERKTIDGNTPAIGVGEGLYLCENAASVAYVGMGTWTLPLGNVFAFGETEICVRNGTLRLSDSTTPDLVANPPAELQKAVLWLDATKNMRTEVIGNYTCVLDWFDARESSAAASSYGYAVASDTTGGGPILGSNYVGFRGYASSIKRSFLYKSVDGTAVSYNVRHAFFVMRADSTDRTAPILGNTQSANFFAASSQTDCPILSSGGNASPLAYSSEYLLDGIHGNATTVMPTGTHLHEFTLPPNRTIGVDSLMRDRGSASGGHDIHEILLFTQPLTVLERMRISAYLKAKWSCDGSLLFSVRTVDGACVELSEDLSPDSVEMSGRGAIAVDSGCDREVAHLYGTAQKERLPYLLRDGTSSLSLQATEYEYRLLPHDRLNVASQTRLSVLTKDVAGADGSATVASGRPFVVSRLDAAITNLAVSGGGDLVLRASTSSDPGYMFGTVSAATFAATSLSVPAGNTTAAETTVVVPAAGDWELAFSMSNTFTSSSDNAGVAFTLVQLKSGNTVVWERKPTAVDPSKYDNAAQVKRYLLRNLAAGTYTLRAVGVAPTAIAASIADLSLIFVPNPTHETVVPVTDGDFESSRFVKAFYASVDNNNKVAEVTPWTLTNGGITTDPPLQTVVSSYMGYSGSYDFMFRSSQQGRYGDNALVWYHNTSTATSPATVLPGGTHRLRFDAVRWMTGTTSHSKVANGDAGRCNTAATLTASVTVNGGEPVSLGAVGPISSFTLETLSFPNEFTVSEGDSVTVTLNQTTAKGAVQLDNFEFVKVEGGSGSTATLGEELVQDGSCVSKPSDYWTFDDWTGSYRHVAEIRKWDDNVEAFGATMCDGPYMIRSAQGGRAYQTIAFPAGVFRLSWWSRARFDASTGNVNSGARTPITFWYAADGSATTNEIVKSETSWCTNFIEHVAYFSVPTAGSYVFGFNSEDRSGSDVLVDCVSVKQVLGAEAVPDIPEYAEINVSGGGKLRLDYNGCLNLGRLKVNGKSLMGEVSAEKYPDYISGPGRALVKQRGLVLMYR